MKQKKCRTTGRQKKIIGIATSLLLILCIFAGYFYLRYAEGYRTFHAPEHEEGAAKGNPSGSHAGHYEELPVRDGYVVGIDTSPLYHDGSLYLHVANRKDNTVWLMAQVYKEEEQIAKTGIFYPDEYVKKIPCSQKLSAGDKLLIRVLAYEPDTYHSEGVAQISTTVAGE